MSNTTPLHMSLILAAGLLAACAKSPSAESELTPTEKIHQWRENRDTRLRQPNGWLSLVGLDWLQEGENPIGSDRSNRVVLPSEAVPPIAGNIRLEDGTVTLTVTEGAGITHDSVAVTNLVLLPDVSGTPTILEAGTLTFYLIQREAALGIRIKDSESQALKDYPGMDYYDINGAWRVTAKYEPHDIGGYEIAVPTFQGPTQYLASPGTLVFTINGREHRLDVFAEEGDEEFFVIFGDGTNGKETYGGGRFLDTPLPDERGMVEIDFNLAYCPPCVFTPFATCPLPPQQNRLSVNVEVGEKMYDAGEAWAPTVH